MTTKRIHVCIQHSNQRLVVKSCDLADNETSFDGGRKCSEMRIPEQMCRQGDVFVYLG